MSEDGAVDLPADDEVCCLGDRDFGVYRLPAQAPRSSTELFPEALRLSPKQREVLNALQEYPQGARAVLTCMPMSWAMSAARDPWGKS